MAVLSFSVRNARAAKRIARKLALASMMELDMALARESPREKKKYCPIVWKSDKTKMGLMSRACGTRGRRWAALIPTITRTPASVKRKPAKSSCEALSCAGIPKSA